MKRGELLSDLGLGEPHRLGSLQRRGRGPQLLQPGNPINPPTYFVHTLDEQ